MSFPQLVVVTRVRLDLGLSLQMHSAHEFELKSSILGDVVVFTPAFGDIRRVQRFRNKKGYRPSRLGNRNVVLQHREPVGKPIEGVKSRVKITVVWHSEGCGRPVPIGMSIPR